jgi:hypothetical protein
MTAAWAYFDMEHIGFQDGSITKAMTCLQLKNAGFPDDVRYTPAQVCERLLAAVASSSFFF